jgi:hypothetical protein
MKPMALNNGQDIAGLLNPGTFSLSPEAATAELARLTAEFGKQPQPAPDTGPTPADRSAAVTARAQLEALKADPAFARRVLAGDAAASAQLNELTTAIAEGSGDADLALAGIHPDQHVDTGSGASLRDQIAAVQPLREAGIDDSVIRQVLEDVPVSRAEYAAAEQLQRQLMGNAEWRARILENDFEAKRQLQLLSVILASRIEGE